jgi:hypothetical protein
LKMKKGNILELGRIVWPFCFHLFLFFNHKHAWGLLDIKIWDQIYMLYTMYTLNVSNSLYFSVWIKINFNLKQILSCKIHSCTFPSFLLEFGIAKKRVSMVEWTNLDVIKQFFQCDPHYNVHIILHISNLFVKN